MLDSTKAYKKLFWKPVWDIDKTIQRTIEWYQTFYNSGTIISEQVLTEYISDAQEKCLEWCK